MSNLSFTLESNSDDDFFGNLECKRSNLGQLFGIGTIQENEDHTLKYQPTKSQFGTTFTGLTTTPEQIWNTQLAKVTNAYKAGELVGKVGVAFLTKSAENESKIIVYKTKNNVLATCSLNFSVASVHMHRKSRYLQFYDDEQVYWSLRFDTEVDEDEFIQKLQEFNVKVMQEPLENIVETANVVSAKEPIETTLITRMAKMGQQLPKLTTVSQLCNEYSDSSDTEAVALPINSNKPSIMPRNSKLQTKTQTQVVTATNVGMYNVTETIANVNAIEAQFLQMMLTENRTQNTEMRMNMNKLESKIEKVLDKFDLFNTGSNQKTNKEDEILELEEKLLKFKKENRKLRQSLEKCDQSCDLKIVGHVLEIYKDDLHAIGILPNNDLNTSISNLIERTIKLHNNLELRKSELAIKSKELEENETKLIEETAKNSDELKKIIKLENIITTLQTKLEIKEQDKKLQTRLAEQNIPRLDQNALGPSETEVMVKQIMNSLYGNLSVKIENVDKLDKNLIIALIGKSIREETLKAIEQIKK